MGLSEDVDAAGVEEDEEECEDCGDAGDADGLPNKVLLDLIAATKEHQSKTSGHTCVSCTSFVCSNML